MPDQRQKTRLDVFLSTLEDTLAEDRARGQPVRSLRDFSRVAGRSVSAARNTRRAKTDGIKVVKSIHGRYAVALPDGSLKADSQNPSGDWEKFEVIPALDGKVLFKSHHEKYIIARSDGSLGADSDNFASEEAQFEMLPNEDGTVLIKSCVGKYLIAMPDGNLRADSDNPHGTWERFEVTKLEKDFICDRAGLFAYLDRLSEEGVEFKWATYVVNQWNLGGVVRLKHHGCILTEAKGHGHLKFDFGRWGIGWSRSDEYPEHPRGTCLVQTYETKGDPQTVKRYCAAMQSFSWTENNCSTFSLGLIQELCGEQPKRLMPDLWPKWSYCLATPPIKMPTRRGTASSRGNSAPALATAKEKRSSTNAQRVRGEDPEFLVMAI